MGFILQVLFSFVIQVISNSMRLWKCIDKFVNWEVFAWGFFIVMSSYEIDVLNVIASILFIEDFEFYATALKWIGAYCAMYSINLLLDIKIAFWS